MSPPGVAWAECPEDIRTLADQQQLPVLCLDYQVSRRKRLHLCYSPGDKYPFAFERAVEAIDQVMENHEGPVLLMTILRNGSTAGCQAIFKPLDTPG